MFGIYFIIHKIVDWLLGIVPWVSCKEACPRWQVFVQLGINYLTMEVLSELQRNPSEDLGQTPSTLAVAKKYEKGIPEEFAAEFELDTLSY